MPELSLTVRPDPVLVQASRGLQRLSFEFYIENNASLTWTLRGLELLVLDEHQSVIRKRFLNENSAQPSIATLPERTVPPEDRICVFNPFMNFDETLPISHLRCRLHFTADEGKELTLEAELFPQQYAQKARLMLPLEGRLLVPVHGSSGSSG